MSSDWLVAGPILLAGALLTAFVLYLVHGPDACKRERELAQALRERGVPVRGRVVSIERDAGGNMYANATRLDVAVEQPGGGERVVRMHVLIDRELMVNFMPGRQVGLLRDPDDPGRMAVDRQASPTEIPAPWRDRGGSR